MKITREYKNRRLLSNIEDLCTILTDPNRDVNDLCSRHVGEVSNIE